MEKTQIMISNKFNLIFGLVMCFMYINCSQSEDNYKKAKSFYMLNHSESFVNFKDWEVYKRDGEIILDYYDGDTILSRAVVKHISNYSIKWVIPFQDTSFLLFSDAEKEKRFKSIRPSKEIYLSNVKRFENLKVDKILYRKSFDGLIIQKNKLTMVHLLSLKAIHELPNNYQLIDKNWYYYVEK